MRIQGNTTAGKLLDSSKASLLNNLKAGDVLQGIVKQLYPNHKAAIQMQGSQLIAQLEASLSVGGKYFFQVTSNERKMPELKVITGEQQNGKQLIDNLLQQLGIKETRLSSQLVSALAREQVPMQRSDLLQAIQYTQDNKISAQQAQPVLMQLMKLRIPVTAASFQAVQAYQGGSISESLAALERSLPPGGQPMLQVNLEYVLRGFISEESAVRAVLTADVQQEKPALFPLLQDLGLVSKALDKQGWISVLQQWSPRTSQNLRTVTPPFTTSFEGVKEQLQSVLENKRKLMIEARALHGAIMQGTPPSLHPKANLEAQFLQYFSNHNQVTQGNAGTVLPLVEALLEPKSYQALERLVNIWTASNENIINNPKEQFLHQLQWVLRDAGLNAESSLKTDDASSMQFKHLLLEMLQNSSGGIGRENAQQVLHFLNGMQLNNINDSNYFVQANIQIPSQKLGLSKDIDLHFEGKKTSDGNIDPAYCRIIFDLQLHSMKETIIDLHVQKKALSITVYNDQATTPVLVDKFRPGLQEALEKINYQIASIVCKPYTETDKQPHQKGRTADEKAGQGKVDFRV